MRLFIAVWLSPELNEKVTRFVKTLAAGSVGVKWTEGEQLHFTLKFLGEQGPEMVFQIAPLLQSVARDFPVFTLSLGRGGVFPSRQSPRVLWLGVKEGLSEVADLARRVEEILSPCGFPRERKPFKPHLTLGRVKKDNPAFDWRLLEEGVTGTMQVTGFSLVESELTPAGARYRVVEDYPFPPRLFSEEGSP